MTGDCRVFKFLHRYVVGVLTLNLPVMFLLCTNLFRFAFFLFLNLYLIHLLGCEPRVRNHSSLFQNSVGTIGVCRILTTKLISCAKFAHSLIKFFLVQRNGWDETKTRLKKHVLCDALGLFRCTMKMPLTKQWTAF